MIAVSVFLPFDALSQHLPFYLGFSYLGHRVSLHSCSSKAQPLLFTLDMGQLLSATAPDPGLGVAPLGRSCAITQPPLLCHSATTTVHSVGKDLDTTIATLSTYIQDFFRLCQLCPSEG